MILTCPACATRYFVDESKLGPMGRKVRCAGCGSSWRAEPDGEPLDLARAATPIASPVAGAPEDLVGPAPASVRPAEALPKSFRARAEARRRSREAMAAGAVWSGVAAAVVVALLAAVVFRVQVVAAWPRTAGAYAALRLPVNPLGLAPEQVAAAPGLQDGRAMLFVKGVERNVEAAPRAPAALRISVLDKSGARLASRVVQVDGGALKPGEARPFRAAFADPPLAGADVKVDFVFPTAPPRRVRPAALALSPARTETAAAGTGPRLRGVVASPAPSPMPLQAVKLAQPLPVGSPDALPVAAAAQAGGLPRS